MDYLNYLIFTGIFNLFVATFEKELREIICFLNKFGFIYLEFSLNHITDEVR